MSEPWLSTLLTDTPEEGFALAVKMSRMGVKTTQPDVEVLHKLRPVYANNADSRCCQQLLAVRRPRAEAGPAAA